jgi:hypothetical protein
VLEGCEIAERRELIAYGQDGQQRGLMLKRRGRHAPTRYRLPPTLDEPEPEHGIDTSTSWSPLMA